MSVWIHAVVDGGGAGADESKSSLPTEPMVSRRRAARRRAATISDQMLDDCDRDAYLALNDLIEVQVPPPITLSGVLVALEEAAGDPLIAVIRSWARLSRECLIDLAIDICKYESPSLRLVAPAADVYLSLLLQVASNFVVAIGEYWWHSKHTRLFSAACIAGRIALVQAAVSMMHAAGMSMPCNVRVLEETIENEHDKVVEYLLATVEYPQKVLLDTFMETLKVYQPGIATMILVLLTDLTTAQIDAALAETARIINAGVYERHSV